MINNNYFFKNTRGMLHLIIIKTTDLVEGLKKTDQSPSNLSSSSFSKLRKEHIQKTSCGHV